MYCEKILEVRNLNKTFESRRKKNTVFNDFSLKVGKGEFLSLLGPSGCGKSTLLEMIAGFDMDYTGDMIFRGEIIAGTSGERAVVFQKDALFPWLSVFDNIAYGLKIKKMKSEDIKVKVEYVLDKVGLLDFVDHFPEELSGGMKQRVALARVLVMEPEVLLMDEPFGALDSFTRLRMQELMIEIREKFSITVIFVTHDIDEALMLSDRIVMMDADNKDKCWELRPELEKHYNSLTEKMMDEKYMGYKKEIIEWFHIG